MKWDLNWKVDRSRLALLTAPIVVSAICLFLGVNVGVITAELNAQTSLSTVFTTQIADLQSELTNTQAKFYEQNNTINELHASLEVAKTETDTAKKESETAKNEVNTLKTANNDLTSRLNSVIEALEKPLSDTTETASEASASKAD